MVTGLFRVKGDFMGRPRKNPVAQAYDEEEEKPIVLGPCSPKQRLVLQDHSTDILLIGGGAGGGKSYLALLKALKYCQDPAARVLIVRLTYPVLKAIGGLVDESQQIYSLFGAEWKVQPLEWHFPNGAMIKFVAMPANRQEVQGWQATNIIVDEGAEFQLEDILALKERIRGARYKGKLGMTITCNPNRNSWLYPFVEYCLNPEDGVPLPGTEDRVRYFIVRNGKVLWGDTEDELFELHGEGLNRDPKKGRLTFMPTSFRFIPMDVYSNPVLLKNNPGYLANLQSGTRVSQLRFLYGSWTAVPEGSSVFNREWIKIVEFPPTNPAQRVRSWDLAHSVPSETYPNPDWTAGVRMSRTREGMYCIEHVERDRKLTDGVVRMIIDTATHEDGLEQLVTIPRDNGGGKAATQFFLRAFAEAGMHVRGIPITNQSSKMQRFLPFCTLAEAGLVTMVRAPWNEDFLTELEYFDGTRNVKDDQVDATSDAFNTLAKQTTMPTIRVPDMTNPNPVPRI
jgi:predicted phage terminase large subunit-like protein